MSETINPMKNLTEIDQEFYEKFGRQEGGFWLTHPASDFKDGWIKGYNAAMSEGKQQGGKWTDNDMRKCFEAGRTFVDAEPITMLKHIECKFRTADDYLKSLSV